MSSVKVIEVTVRDGGYEIDHDYSVESVAAIASTLDAAGFEYIEVGHGTGFAAHTHDPKIRAKPTVMTDEDHLRIAREATKRAKLGVLFGTSAPWLCPIAELDRLAGCKADFVRLAMMPADLTGDGTLAYIERARSLGMTVSINLMQTYVAPPAVVAAYATRAARAGLAWFYIVDSSGGMQPDEVRKYVRALRDETDLRVGFHAHNNGGLAVANSLAAVDAGATLVDSTISGLGRATGNAPTEQLVLALQRLGHETAIDVDAIARMTKLVRPMLAEKGNDAIDVVAGAARIHSRGVRALVAEAERRDVPVTTFVLEAGREAAEQDCLTRVPMPAEVLDAAAARCRPTETAPAPALVAAVRRRVDPARSHTLRGIRDDLRARASMYHKQAALHLVPRAGFPFSGALPWESESLVGATASWPLPAGGDPAPYPLDLLVVDAELAPPPEVAGVGRVVVASWRDAWIDAATTLLAAASRTRGHRVWLAPATNRRDARIVVERLALLGIELAAERPPSPVAILAVEPPAGVQAARGGDVVVVMGTATDMRAWSEHARTTGALIAAPDLGAAVAARIDALLAAEAALDRLAVRIDEPCVELPRAPAPGQAVVDLRTGAIVDGGGARGDLVDCVALLRARQLSSGRTRL